MARVARAEAWDREATLVAAVPLHARKRRERGFNQSEAIARDLATQLGLPFRDLLLRTRDTPPQGSPTTLSRARNVEGAFALRPRGLRRRLPRLRGAAVLLVDDVMTSGATLSACARVLRRAGARRVYALAAARGGVPGSDLTPSGGSLRASET
ncbi:MAG TPA: phosphoribosyltransferase family protein [Planctomycetota bacterium]|jgi:predicted amidophosphoribosyltransferase|nr:phosphoribosyltransferase family protein [Planctomycetota bacterium]